MDRRKERGIDGKMKGWMARAIRTMSTEVPDKDSSFESKLWLSDPPLIINYLGSLLDCSMSEN